MNQVLAIEILKRWVQTPRNHADRQYFGYSSNFVDAYHITRNLLCTLEAVTPLARFLRWVYLKPCKEVKGICAVQKSQNKDRESYKQQTKKDIWIYAATGLVWSCLGTTACQRLVLQRCSRPTTNQLRLNIVWSPSVHPELGTTTWQPLDRFGQLAVSKYIIAGAALTSCE